MLDVLLESKAARTRRTGGTVASMLAHAALIVGAIVVTTRNGRATMSPPEDYMEPPPVYVTPRPAPPETKVRPPTSSPRTIDAMRRLPTIDHVPNVVPPVDVDLNVRIATDDEIGHGPIVSSSTDGRELGGGGHAPEGVLEERYVDRAPRIVGTPIPPAFPTALRERGIGGRVAVQFVVDTLGRAEMGSLRIVEASDPQFAQSVRAVLPRYRFSPGEVDGRRVRTLVQLPFDFTLVR